MIYKLQDGNTLPSLQSIQRLKKRNEPKEDAWGKEKERVQKETDKIKQENSWMGKTANVLHHIGVGATGLGLLGSFITAPAATALGLIGGIAGEQAVNKATKKVSDFLTNGKGKTWNEYAEQLGLSPTLAAITNPGGWFGGGLGVKASQYRPKPGYLGMNGAPMKKVNNISYEDLKPMAEYLKTNKEAEITHPIVTRQLSENQKLGDIITDLASKQPTIELPLFNNTGVKPNAVTVAETIIEGANRGFGRNQRYNTAYEGIQPIQGQYKTTKSMGDYDYSSNNQWNATQYADVGRPEWGSIKLMDNGFMSDSPQYKYAIERYRIIGDLQNKYKSKWGKYQTRNPQGVKNNNYGTKEVNMSQQHLAPMSPEDQAAYLKAMQELSEFWGSGESSLHAGGLKQRVIAVPDQNSRVRITFNKPTSYEKLSNGTIYNGMLDRGKPLSMILEKDGIINTLSQTFNKKKLPYFQIENLLDPLPGTTYGSRLGKSIWGMKKGGKYVKRIFD